MTSLLAALLLAQTSPMDARVELQVIPITAQANVLQSEHFGSGGRLTVRLNRYLAGYASGFGNWYTAPSAALDDLHDRNFRIDIYTPTQVLTTWQAALGLESIPLSGSFQLGQTKEGEFGIVVRAGIGLGGARIRLKEPTVTRDGSPSPATFGDTGVRLVGDFGLGLRFGFGAFAVHLGGRLSMWSDEISRINNCSLDDLRAMDMKLRGGMNQSEAVVTPGCVVPVSNDVPVALTVIRTPRQGVVLNVSADLGVSWSF